MKQLHYLSLETLSGNKTIEMRHLDIKYLDQQIDTLIISAASFEYYPTPGTLIETLKASFDIDVDRLSRSPEYDLRENYAIWLSTEIKDKQIKRIACVERLSFYYEGSFRKAIIDIFGLIAMANLNGASIHTVALPVLGAGAQNVPLEKVLPTLVNASKTALEQNSSLNRVIFFEKDEFKLQKLKYEFESIIKKIKPLVIFNYKDKKVTIEGKNILFTPFEYCYYLYFALRRVEDQPPVNYSVMSIPEDLLSEIYSLHETVFPDLLGMRMEMRANLKNGLGRDISTFRAYISKVNRKIRSALKEDKVSENYYIQKIGPRGSIQLQISIPSDKIQIIIPSNSPSLNP